MVHRKMVQRKTLIATAILAALGGALASQVFFSAPAATDFPATISPDAQHNSQLDDSTGHTTTALQQTIGRLQQENQRLKKLLAEHSNQEAAAAKQPNENTAATNQQLQTQLQQLEMEKQLRKASAFSDWVLQAQQENPDFNLNQTLAQQFEHETRDPQWADEQENNYRNLFSESVDLADFALKDSQCKTSQCELTVSIGNLEQSDQLLEKMNKVLAANNKKAALVIAADAQTGTSKLYISENPESFEFQ